MMNRTLIVIGISITFFLILIYKYIYNARKNKTLALNSADAYAQKQITKNDPSQITLSEKTNLSWEFLYEITEKVFSMFSEEDRNETHIQGQNLASNGAVYTHVIEWGIKHHNHVKALEEEKDNDQALALK